MFVVEEKERASQQIRVIATIGSTLVQIVHNPDAMESKQMILSFVMVMGIVLQSIRVNVQRILGTTIHDVSRRHALERVSVSYVRITENVSKRMYATVTPAGLDWNALYQFVVISWQMTLQTFVPVPLMKLRASVLLLINVIVQQACIVDRCASMPFVIQWMHHPSGPALVMEIAQNRIIVIVILHGSVSTVSYLHVMESYPPINRCAHHAEIASMWIFAIVHLTPPVNSVK